MSEENLSMQEQIKFGGSIENWERNYGFSDKEWFIGYSGSMEDAYARTRVFCIGRYEKRSDILDEKIELSDELVYKNAGKLTFKLSTTGRTYKGEIVDIGKCEQTGKKEIYDFFVSAAKKYEEEQKNPKPKKRSKPARDVLIKKIRELIKNG